MNSNQFIFSTLHASKVAESLNCGALLLTASQPLAVDWKRRLMADSGSEVCETPNVLSWQAWLNALAAGLGTMPVALNRVQEKWLWQQVIHADLPEQSAAAVRGLAGHACEVYALMQEYQIAVDELAFGGEEADALLGWIDALHRRLGEGGFSEHEPAGRILAADIGQHVLRCVENIEKPASILLAGFDDMTPMQQALLTALQAAGVRIAQVQDESRAAVPTLYACSDVQAEGEHIAARIQALLAVDVHARIGIVSSDAVKDLSVLQRTLNDALMPELSVDPANTMNAVSMSGATLSDSPMIRQLLHVLSLAGEFSLSFDEFSVLLFSPWLKGYKSERFERAELDAKFRQQNRHRLTFKGLLNSSYVQKLPALLDVLKALAAWNKNKRSANDWVKKVHELLKATGFVQTGTDQEIPRTNHEIRQMNAFRDVLIGLVAVDALNEKLSWMQFLSLLRTGCSEVRLTEAAKYANVMVLPLAQVSGLQFDHVLLMGFDEEAFPPPARPYPLLPSSVQKKYALPMSNGALVYEASEKLWQVLLASAENIDISYAKQRDDKELLASSFVAGFELQDGEILAADTLKLALEAFDDASDVPLVDGENVRGGTSIIRNQSACPFRAFATHRLGIAALGETSPGIEAKSKGSLIHLALEYIWRNLQTQQALAALDDAAALALIDAAITHAWDESYVVADSRTRTYEKKRMQAVLLEWFALELDRPAFKVVAIEQEYVMRLPECSDNPFKVKIKADRMDVDASGRKILIDYKTGAKQSTRTWLADEANNGRIEEPQLPQYALAAGLGADDAVAFARVRRGDMSFEGLCGDAIEIKGIVACDGKRGVPEDWQAVLDDWKIHINALAQEFVDGRCDVSPRDKGACKYCGFEAICRIEEVGFEHE